MDVIKLLPADIGTGVYFGWANVDNGDVHKMVMSIGWNPFYNNTEKSMVIIFYVIDVSFRHVESFDLEFNRIFRGSRGYQIKQCFFFTFRKHTFSTNTNETYTVVY